MRAPDSSPQVSASLIVRLGVKPSVLNRVSVSTHAATIAFMSAVPRP
jgi:hypothetical protein